MGSSTFWNAIWTGPPDTMRKKPPNGSLTSPPSWSAHHVARGTGSVESTVTVTMRKVMLGILGRAADTAIEVPGPWLDSARE